MGCSYQYILAAAAKRQLSAMIDMHSPSHYHHIHPACSDGMHNGHWLDTLLLQALQKKSKLIAYNRACMQSSVIKHQHLTNKIYKHRQCLYTRSNHRSVRLQITVSIIVQLMKSVKTAPVDKFKPMCTSVRQPPLHNWPSVNWCVLAFLNTGRLVEMRNCRCNLLRAVSETFSHQLSSSLITNFI